MGHEVSLLHGVTFGAARLLILKPKNMSTAKNNIGNDKSANRDPITGEPGSHPVGTGLGAVAGGAAAGAATGTVAGPVGTVIGAAVGAIVGGLAGKGVAEAVNPTAEDAYWRDNHKKQSFAKGLSYEDYSPAYRNGYEGYAKYGSKGATYHEKETELRLQYEALNPKMPWSDARLASRAAWQRFESPHQPGTIPD